MGIKIFAIFILICVASRFANSFNAKDGISIHGKHWYKTSWVVNNDKKIYNESELEDLLKQPRSRDDYTFEEVYFSVKSDHFDYDLTNNFNLRCLINHSRFDSKGPILFYTGNEGPIDDFYQASGWVVKTLADEFNGLVVFCEHRFFGASFPMGKNQGYKIKFNKLLTSEQALADFAEVANKLKYTHNLSNPIILFGGSYGGMLSAWGRMKYPNLFAGSISSSAPVLLFEKVTNEFFKITTETYKRYESESVQCVEKIRQGFFLLDKISSAKPSEQDLKIINSAFKPCKPITSSAQIEALSSNLNDFVVVNSQYNYPYDFEIGGMKFGGNPAQKACEAVSSKKTLDSGSVQFLRELETESNEDILRSIAGVSNQYLEMNNLKCLEIDTSSREANPNGWEYMACSEMVMPFESNGVNDMFSPSTWDLAAFTKGCEKTWNTDVRPKWILDNYGGRNIQAELSSYSNIVFINGTMDPWFSGCIKESSNDKIKVFNCDSAHHLDLKEPSELDPSSMVNARKVAVEQIHLWIEN